MSPSTRRVWIEIKANTSAWTGIIRSPSTRRVWIEIPLENAIWEEFGSHPPHGGCGLKFDNALCTSGFEGSPSTRRVWIEIPTCNSNHQYGCLVTLHTEGVDWNQILLISPVVLSLSHPPHGGCGLKFINRHLFIVDRLSPSTRRVWIEMCGNNHIPFGVARHPPHGGCGLKSIRQKTFSCFFIVTLHTEGVDWNHPYAQKRREYIGHPPHGGCGLK